MSATLAVTIQAAAAISVVTGVILAAVGYRFMWDVKIQRAFPLAVQTICAMFMSAFLPKPTPHKHGPRRGKFA